MTTYTTDETLWATAATTHYSLQFTIDELDGEWIVVDTEDYREPPPDPFLNHYLEE